MRKFDGFYRGINLGGWLSQGSLEKEHLDTFITEEDIKAIKKIGADHIRIPVDFELIEDEQGNILEDGHTYIRKGIDWCLQNDLNVVLDLHKTAGYVFDDAAYSNGFFDNKVLQERFINLWKVLASRYGNQPDRVALELLNEVVNPSVADKWNDIARRTIEAIRAITPDSWIIVGGTRNNSVVSVKELDAPYDERIVFTFHCYEPLIFTHQGAYWIE
ncbi:MAG: cellulase family glycosylhydrolase, partial [Lachnospiraceae bacterium]|nr:cellulase family glycosylhydrolase [Lachnospiraceae bacterium]